MGVVMGAVSAVFLAMFLAVSLDSWDPLDSGASLILRVLGFLRSKDFVGFWGVGLFGSRIFRVLVC